MAVTPSEREVHTEQIFGKAPAHLRQLSIRRVSVSPYVVVEGVLLLEFPRYIGPALDSSIANFENSFLSSADKSWISECVLAAMKGTCGWHAMMSTSIQDALMRLAYAVRGILFFGSETAYKSICDRRSHHLPDSIH